jgi:hypothetical protein
MFEALQCIAKVNLFPKRMCTFCRDPNRIVRFEKSVITVCVPLMLHGKMRHECMNNPPDIVALVYGLFLLTNTQIMYQYYTGT